MTTLLYFIYQVFGLFFFILVSAILLREAMFGRFVLFAFAYVFIFWLGGLFFFGVNVLGFLGTDFFRFWIQVGSILLLFFGTFAVVGWSLYNTHSLSATLGAVFLFLAAMGCLMVIIGITTGYDFISAAIVPQANH